ncbi:MAG TPA: T9SS type A sorting domain-containing protein, partial [Chitinophagales bacterium]|nr:T9SS type A sorting domain-containing protein [Chitinophagales bacterium]HRK27679.1 T9SS type A sorting domain-containing protein [Chitinophagales bacterium]
PASCCLNPITNPLICYTLFDVFVPDVAPVCPGEIALLEAFAWGSSAYPYNYQWSSGTTGPYLWVSPTVNTLYMVTVTDACGRTAVASVIVAVDAGLPNATISPAGPFCVNENPVFLTAATPGGFWWGPGVNTATGLFNPALAYAGGQGPYTISYTVSNGCGNATGSIQIVVNPSGVPVIYPVATLCAGSVSNITLAASVPGGTWSGSGIVGGSNTTGQFSLALALAGGAGPYLVSYTTPPPCGGTDTELIFINPNPAVSISGSTSVCSGSSTLLSASGGGSYFWNTGATTASISVAPLATTTYTITVTGAGGCTASSSVTVVVSNLAPPVINGTSICLGASATLNAGGGYAAYLWSTGQITPAINVNPNVTTNYTVTVTGATGCTATANALVVVYVNPLPVITGSVTFCSGGSTTLSASGGFSGYAWSNGSSQPNITVFNSGNYSVTVTNSAGCTGSAQVSVTQNPQLNPVITGNTSPCPGQSSFLDAGSGYAQYNWSNGATTQVINAPPGNYTVTVSSVNGCTGSATANITPLPTPVVVISGSTGICAGSSTTLSATSGFTQYVWSNGTLGSLLTTAAAGTYTVTATNAQGCTASASVMVSIIPVTPPSLSPAAICIGESVTLNAGGGYVNYTWSNGATGQTNTVSPASNTQYTVTVTTAAGCTASSNVAVTVFAASPPGMPNVSTCLGQGATLNAGGGYAGYTWSTGQTSQIISVNPNLSTTYTVTVTNLQGCSASASATVIVNVATPPNIPAASVCLGSSVTLNAGPGYLSYQWSNGFNTQSIQVSPTVNTSYSVTVNDVFGCSATSLVQVSVNTVAPPTLSPVSICLGSPATLNAGAGYVAYLWSTDLSGQAIVVSPTTNTSYTVTVTGLQGCTASAAAAVTVLPLPSANAGADQTICFGQTTTLFASGGSSYLWSNGQIGSTISVNPVNTASYTVTVTDANNCKSVDEVTVSVYQALSFAGIVGAEPNITCFDNDEYDISFVVNGGTLPYTVNGNEFTGSYTVQNLTTSTYTITVSDALGCVNTISGDNSFCNPSCAVQATILPVYNGACLDGFEVVVQSGPIQPPAYMYGISPTEFQFSPVFTGLSSGEYLVYLSTGCGVELLGTFTQPEDALVVSVSVEKVEQIYVATALPNGGTPPYTYQWSNGDNTGSTTYSGISFTGSVTITDSVGCTKTVNFTQSGTVGITQPDVQAIGFTLYPNPATDRFMVAASGVLAQPALLQLYNLHGQLVYEMQSLFAQPETIPAAHLPAGLYVLNLIADGQIYTHKVWCGGGGK